MKIQQLLQIFMRQKRILMMLQKVVDHPTAGATSNASTNRLIMKLDKKETVPVVMGLPSSIVQLSGEGEEELVKYSFEST